MSSNKEIDPPGIMLMVGGFASLEIMKKKSKQSPIICTNN
jgi:hypothetical protein